jgi:cystathionine beta-lyase/cystathionine gamma-synthase
MDLSYIINELGEERENYFNAISPPIMQTSNFAFTKVDDLAKAFEDEMGGYLYSRGLNPTTDILRKKLAALDGAEDCLVFNNGAAAIFAGIFANVKAGDHVVCVKDPYTWTRRTLEVILSRFGVTVTFIDGRDLANWEEATKPNTTLYVLESPNSWDFALQDIPGVVALAKKRNIVTIIDNSYSTPIYQPVIKMGIDLAAQTATKYISGHSDTLGGVLSGSHAMMKKIFNSEYLTIGSGIQPFNAWLLIRGLRTLPARLERIGRSAQQVVAYIKEHKAVESIIYTADPSFPQYELAKKQMSGTGGLFTFIVKTKRRDDIIRFCEALKHIRMAVSWGGHESLVIPKCAGIKPADFDPADPLHRSIRMYVGLEDPAWLIADLEQALR